MSGKAGKITHLVFQIVFFALSTVGFGLYAWMAGEFISSSIIHSAEGGTTGIAVGFSLIFMIIFGIGAAIATVISLIISAFMARRRDKGLRIYGIVATVVNVLYFLLVVVGCPVLVALNNSGAL